MTQKQMIKEYMEEHGGITPMEAFHFGVTRLAARIAELRADGYRIKTTTILSKNRYGRTVAYAQYNLEAEGDVSSPRKS